MNIHQVHSNDSYSIPHNIPQATLKMFESIRKISFKNHIQRSIQRKNLNFPEDILPKNCSRTTQQNVHTAAMDSAMVTVETALALCTMLIFVFLCLATLETTIYQLRAIDTTRELARLLARDQPDALALVSPPAGIRITTSYTQDFICVSAETTVPIINIHLQAHSKALLEKHL